MQEFGRLNAILGTARDRADLFQQGSSESSPLVSVLLLLLLSLCSCLDRMCRSVGARICAPQLHALGSRALLALRDYRGVCGIGMLRP